MTEQNNITEEKMIIELELDEIINLYDQMEKHEKEEYDAMIEDYTRRIEEEEKEQAIQDALQAEEYLYDRTHCASCYKEMEMSVNGGRPVCSKVCHDDLDLEYRMSYDKYMKY
jgi:hypothetical protein